MFLFELLINQHIFITPNTNMILFNPKLNLRFFPFSALYTIKPTNIKKINSIRKNIYSFIYILLREFSLLMYIMGVNPSNKRLRASKQVKITRQPHKIWSVKRDSGVTTDNIVFSNNADISKNTMIYQTEEDTKLGKIVAKGFLSEIMPTHANIMHFISKKDQVFSRKKKIFYQASRFYSNYVEYEINKYLLMVFENLSTTPNADDTVVQTNTSGTVASGTVENAYKVTGTNKTRVYVNVTGGTFSQMPTTIEGLSPPQTPYNNPEFIVDIAHDIIDGVQYEIIHLGLADDQDGAITPLKWNNIDNKDNATEYTVGSRFFLNTNLTNLNGLIDSVASNNIIIPGKIIQVSEPDPGEVPGRTTRNAIFLFNYSLSKVGSRYGSGFGIGNQGGNSLFSFKLNNRIKPHNNWNPLQLNNPTFNSKLYQKNDNHTSFPYSKFCNYRRRQDVPRFLRLNSNGTLIVPPTSRNKLSKAKNRY